MSNISIYINEIRNNLKLIEKLPNKRFKCLCLICNKEHIIRREKFGRDKSCGCNRVITGKENCHFQGHEEIHLGKWKTYINNAKKRNIEFSVSIEYAWLLYIKQNKLCAITKLPIYFWVNATERQSTASLDRIDNTKGYVEGNIHWVHKKINQIKMDMELETFITLCKLVSNNN